MFDANQTIAMNLRTPAGLKTVRVRLPTDEKWIERQKKRKVIVKQLGRGVSETTIPDSAEADAALLAKIRVPEEDAPEVDAFEASRIIEQLSQAEVDDVVQEGDGSGQMSSRRRWRWKRSRKNSTGKGLTRVGPKLPDEPVRDEGA